MNKTNNLLNAVNGVVEAFSNLLPPRSSLLTLPSFLLALTSSLLAFLLPQAAEAEMPAALTYRGMLKYQNKGDTAIKPGIYPITFSVYDSLRPATLLWQRTIPVNVGTNGVFYTELSDTASVARKLPGVKLADALASTKGMPEIGVSMDDGQTEMLPRQLLSTGVRAARAHRTRGVDLAEVAGGVLVSGAAGVNELYTKKVTVSSDAGASFPSTCTLLPMNTRVLGSTNSVVTVRDVVLPRPAWPAEVGASQLFNGTAQCDAIVTYEGEDGAFNLIVPGGGKIENGDAAVQQTVSVSAFGTLK